ISSLLSFLCFHSTERPSPRRFLELTMPIRCDDPDGWPGSHSTPETGSPSDVVSRGFTLPTGPGAKQHRVERPYQQFDRRFASREGLEYLKKARAGRAR